MAKEQAFKQRSPTMKSQRLKRRGRKQGDGILKELNPRNGALDNFKKLIFGRFADDPLAEMIYEFWGVCEQDGKLAKRAIELGKERIEEAKSDQDHDKEATAYLHNKGINDRRFKDKLLDFQIAAGHALIKHNAEWFRKVAEIIEKGKPDQACYPLHTALMMVARLEHTQVVTVAGRKMKQYTSNPPLSMKPRYDIGEICKLLEKHGMRPANHNDDISWQTQVRHACKQIGFPLLQAKTGRPKKRSVASHCK